MEHNFRRLIAAVLSVFLLFGLLPAGAVAAEGEKADWAFYIYLCGSDLETYAGCASIDLCEMIEADMPENVRVIVMTGGAAEWNPIGIPAYGEEGSVGYVQPSSDTAQIYEVGEDGMTLLLDYGEQLDMGAAETAACFVRDAWALAPAEHVMFCAWNHGGGPFDGAEYDENTGNCLSADDFVLTARELSAVKGGKIDVFGFDACLMSSFEVACMLSPYAEYLVASEETEPGRGWNYDFLTSLSALVADGGSFTAETLGRKIVDAYAYSSADSGSWEDVTACTLALTDLGRIDAVKQAFDGLAAEMVKTLPDEAGSLPDELVRLSRAAEKAAKMELAGEYYGLVDLYSLASAIGEEYSGEVMGEKAEALKAAIGEYDEIQAEKPIGSIGKSASGAVVYRGTDSNYNGCAGLTVYYPVIGHISIMGNYGGAEETLRERAGMYDRFDISGNYAAFLSGIAEIGEKITGFRGSLQGIVDGDTYTLGIPEGEESTIVSVKYSLYTDILDLNGEEFDYNIYLLGSRRANYDAKAGKYIETPDDEWYAVDGSPITVELVETSEFFPDSGMWISEYAIPAVVYENGVPSIYDKSGKPAISELKGMAIEWDGGEAPMILLLGFIPDRNDVEGGADRVMEISEDMQFHPVLLGYSEGIMQISEDKVLDSRLDIRNDGQSFYIQLDTAKLQDRQGVIYHGRFEALDLLGDLHYSAPEFDYAIASGNLAEYTVQPIEPQPYAFGAPVTPSPVMTFDNEQPLVEGIDYTVTYSGNTEPGTASVLIEPAEGSELTGKAETTFIIYEADRQLDAYAEQIKISDGESAANAGVNVIPLIENAYERYLWGGKGSAESGDFIAERYASLAANCMNSLSQNGVALSGAYGGLDWNSKSALYAFINVYAKSVDPESDELRAAYEAAAKSSGGAHIDCRSVSAFFSDIAEIDVAQGKRVTLSFALPSGVNAGSVSVYRLDGTRAEKCSDCAVVSHGGTSYAVVSADKLGVYALFGESAQTPSPSGGGGGFGGGSSGGKITVSDNLNGGRLSADVSKAASGDIVTVRTTPDAGYVTAEVTVTADSGDSVPVRRVEAGVYSFVMPKGGVEVSARFASPGEMFSDLDDSAWYRTEAAWAIERGIMSGVGGGAFSPNGEASRAMVITMLARMSGEDADGGGTWYEKSVAWAAANGLSDGLRPEAPVTRQELATMLYRYYKLLNGSAEAAITGEMDYTDTADIADWAMEAVRWCTLSGILKGRDTGALDPTGTASRVEVAAMLMRFSTLK